MLSPFVGGEAKAQRARLLAQHDRARKWWSLRKQIHSEKLAPFCKGAMMAH